MPKSIPIQLATHKAQAATTTCLLQKIGPTRSGAYYCFTSLDHDVAYNDGSGVRTYYAGSGFDPSSYNSSNDMGVDNGESGTLLYPSQGITESLIASGDLDAAPFVVYLVNYLDLTATRHEWIAEGVVGEVRVKNGLVTFENRSLSQLMKQNSVVQVDSITCRARFGSQPIGTGGGAIEERYPCKYSLAGEWVTGAVTGITGEAGIAFQDTSLTQADAYFQPGIVEWQTGANAGQQQEIDTFVVGGSVTLKFPTRNGIQLGDTYRIRRDCTKAWSGTNSCQTFNNRSNFRGEPFIPISDVMNIGVPGAGA